MSKKPYDLVDEEEENEDENEKTTQSPAIVFLKDFLTFRFMIAPILIQVMFWSVTALLVVGGVVKIIQSFGKHGTGDDFRDGFLAIVFGPILLRLWCEVLMLLFKIHDELKAQRSKI
jgi:uncharacterized membrane protein HdeD (DUF308 family)